MNNSNYLDLMGRLGLPKAGWIAYKDKFRSEARDIPTSFTGGFAKNVHLLRHEDVPFVIVVSDDVKDYLTKGKQSRKKKSVPAIPAMHNLPAEELKSNKDDDDKVANRLIEEDERVQKLREKKLLLKEKFDSFQWNDVGFAGEAQTGTIGPYTFYFGPSSDDGRWFYKINEIACSRKKNRNTLEEAKADAFESFWKIIVAKEQTNNV